MLKKRRTKKEKSLGWLVKKIMSEVLKKDNEICAQSYFKT